MSISNKDYKDLKSRIANSNVRIQFGVGDYLDAKGYEGVIGEPILLKDKNVFAVCDGKSIANRKYYPINNSMQAILDDNLDAVLEHMINFFIEKVPVGMLTAKFPVEGRKLNGSKLIEAFTNTNKFCIPDGRLLPQNCYATKVLGMTYAPYLLGGFLRHYDAKGLNDSVRTIGHIQSSSLKKHKHLIKYKGIDYDERYRLFKRAYGSKREDSWYWKDGSYALVYGIVLGSYVAKYHFPKATENAGSETRPKNLAYLSFYRYDL
ncbi:hypothetical protein bcCo53_001675 (plasmid) [Borrelia coriaceae]|uniref:Uncharacterized protein n=1 Tax=Borrelia coriaceae ATCC 43381 TaxID=1408429 RepID=W5SY52_9SPIR|nr:hypothetical protein [Borrelia coriaceae]AHH11820.1 Hypothetical protein BCO_0121302 [Borrelia coriaceae ATCC 43381]UPA17471.1 hypothetical protein bcCo53_001675 [Borrelia coriaceae]